MWSWYRNGSRSEGEGEGRGVGIEGGVGWVKEVR